MGLAGPRNRRKIDHDPNNTKWTRDETTFGQKILRAQGWEPGKYLGAQETSHAQLHSAASLAPIKVSLKDDTLGLGARIRQKQSDECTGLDVFKDLLGRLNGKSEETLDKERQIRSVIKTSLFVERKYGPMRFVSGGLLVGDHIKMAELVNNKREPTPIKEESISEASETEAKKSEKKEKKQKKSKKRKASEAEAEEVDVPDSKREKKRKKRAQLEEEEKELGSNDAEVLRPTKKEKGKKEKKSKRSEKDSKSGEPEGKVKKSKKSKKTSGQDSLSDISTDASEDAASEKATKKEKKKHKKRKQADGIEADIPTTSTVSSTAPQDSGSSTPSNTSTPTPHALSARHRARSRHIASKKLAFGDMQALNQIFMIKPV